MRSIAYSDAWSFSGSEVFILGATGDLLMRWGTGRFVRNPGWVCASSISSAEERFVDLNSSRTKIDVLFAEVWFACTMPDSGVHANADHETLSDWDLTSEKVTRFVPSLRFIFFDHLRGFQNQSMLRLHPLLTRRPVENDETNVKLIFYSLSSSYSNKKHSDDRWLLLLSAETCHLPSGVTHQLISAKAAVSRLCLSTA